ncbi:hypothetical protein PLESTB_000502800 [Pleodorina starrii]|uniref:Uncharacterized protein n=1 Tax=Pleodorina starrii TaxID=330485 RepID=A0A9W6BH10_9CHLO|nr:hypothetical protein PLESTM_001773700 [Pleodorina starrii]GLC51442.1 hypothetical protein PLESTB_000502800 [Pleodorina starrii]GLC67740.1 hypothetical protein PLESTF_000600600 [Pleodorina starrii]
MDETDPMESDPVVTNRNYVNRELKNMLEERSRQRRRAWLAIDQNFERQLKALDLLKDKLIKNDGKLLLMQRGRTDAQQAEMRNNQQRLLQIHTAQEAAAAATAADTAAAAVVKDQKQEAGPEAALGPVGAVTMKLEAAAEPKAEAAPMSDAPGPAGGPWPAESGREAGVQGHAPGPETSGRGPAVLTIHAGREAAAAAAGAGSGLAAGAVKSER